MRNQLQKKIHEAAYFTAACCRVLLNPGNNGMTQLQYGTVLQM
jgi:hypothetical protein